MGNLPKPTELRDMEQHEHIICNIAGPFVRFSNNIMNRIGEHSMDKRMYHRRSHLY
ncbi:hypothetical protein [Paenibacillus jamilae]|uniref:hypothetical protein n=1 Tax=Paenibacillus jamilae TaxID=114136 RepID=UPI000ADCB692|nr:hypothetical protein [Paenibacillus jamilae]